MSQACFFASNRKQPLGSARGGRYRAERGEGDTRRRLIKGLQAATREFGPVYARKKHT